MGSCKAKKVNGWNKLSTVLWRNPKGLRIKIAPRQWDKNTINISELKQQLERRRIYIIDYSMANLFTITLAFGFLDLDSLKFFLCIWWLLQSFLIKWSLSSQKILNLFLHWPLLDRILALLWNNYNGNFSLRKSHQQFNSRSFSGPFLEVLLYSALIVRIVGKGKWNNRFLSTLATVAYHFRQGRFGAFGESKFPASSRWKKFILAFILFKQRFEVFLWLERSLQLD